MGPSDVKGPRERQSISVRVRKIGNPTPTFITYCVSIEGVLKDAL